VVLTVMTHRRLGLELRTFLVLWAHFNAQREVVNEGTNLHALAHRTRELRVKLRHESKCIN
jgi:hypothetical protein